MLPGLNKQRLARSHVVAVRAATTCRECGRQPIDFHRTEHEQHPSWRVANLATAGRSIERIDAEIACCIPLCRRCHMRMDGRLQKLGTHPRQTTPAKPCAECGRMYKPLRRGKCSRCYQPYVRTTTDAERREQRAKQCRERNSQDWMREKASSYAKNRKRDDRGVFVGGL